MSDVYFDIMFPLQGMDTSCDLWQQRYGTTVAGVNVRAYDSGTDRLRGGTRAGLTPFFGAGSTIQVNGFNVVQSLSCVVTAAPSAVSAPGSSGPGPVPSGPSISLISPNTASLAGNVPLVITGTGFTGATSLTFGTVPAMGWKVVSDTVIRCIMYPVNLAGVVDVTVTTPTGSTSSAFTFEEVSVGTTVDRILFATSAEEIFGYLALAEDGNLWGTIQGTSKLLKLEPDGTATVVTVTGGYTDGGPICSGPDGNLAIAGNDTPVLYRVSLTGTTISTVSLGSGSGHFPRTVLFGPDGNTWVIQPSTSPSNSTQVFRIAADDTVTSLSIPLIGAYQGCFASDGFLYIVDDNDDITRNVYKIDLTVTLIDTIEITSIPAGCFLYGICQGNDGKLWITYSDFDTLNGFATAMPSGLASATVLPLALSAFEFVNFPFAGPNAKIYVPTYFQDDVANVVQMTSGGMGTLIPLTGSDDTSNSSFNGCVDSNGQVCVAMGGTTGVVQPSVYKVDT